MVRDTPPYGHAPTYQLSLTYFERQKCYDMDNKILFKKQLFDLEVKGQGPMKVSVLLRFLLSPPNNIWRLIVFAPFLLLIIIIMSPLRTKGDILF
jgi:hypothetical protein